MEFWATLVLFGMVLYLIYSFENHRLQADLKAYCLSKGLRYVSHTRLQRPRRKGRYGPTVPGKVALTFIRSNGEEKTIDGEWYGSWFGENISFHHYIEADFGLHDQSAADLTPNMKLEDARQLMNTNDPSAMQRTPQAAAMTHISSDKDAILASEVAKRLDEITQTPGWVHEYDLDGSGHIDSQEWETLRARVVAQVKADLSGHDFLNALEPREMLDLPAELTKDDETKPAELAQDDPAQDAVW